MNPRHRLLALAGLLVLVGLAYWPGLSGPWLFDDFSNIRDNAFLRVTALDWQSLSGAASSLEPGPLGRPVAYLTFALNHYLHGDASPYAYKLTNLAIHGLNALLVAALLGAVLGRLAARQVLPVRLAAPDPDFQRAVRGAAHDQSFRHLRAGGAAVLAAGARGGGGTEPGRSCL
jgi:hypothetical protein